MGGGGEGYRQEEGRGRRDTGVNGEWEGLRLRLAALIWGKQHRGELKAAVCMGSGLTAQGNKLTPSTCTAFLSVWWDPLQPCVVSQHR
jgi:hypothetical protein